MSIITPISSWGGTLVRAKNNGDGTLSLMQSTTPHYLILPLYLATVDLDVLNVEFLGGYKIISTKEFHEKYINTLYDHDNLLHEDTILPCAGMVVNKPSAHYILLKEVPLLNGFSDEDKLKDKETINNEIQKLDLFISALRLLAAGSIHTYRIYFLSDTMHDNRVLKTSTSLFDIQNWYHGIEGEHHFWEYYNINANTLKKVVSTMENLTHTYDRFWLSLTYFNQYHSSYDIVDKLIKLSIIWESTILNDKRDELRYALSLRGSYLLEKDLSDILKTAYDVRSSIVHTGDITPSYMKKMKKILNEDISEFGTLFKFIKNYLEPITRDILNIFLERMVGNNKTLNQIATEIDNEIYSKLGK